MLVEMAGEIDGEAAGAVHAVSADALARTGETLGLGELQRASITGPNTACVIAFHGDEVVGVYVDPKKPIGPFESKLDVVLRR
jgi:predicted regulator of Ras-like GTPase activity (Roadblock/LC7/MglB family)